jgi:hypothetical protein
MIFSASLNATALTLNEVPTKWRLQNYLVNYPVIWRTGPSCALEPLVFPAKAKNQYTIGYGKW